MKSKLRREWRKDQLTQQLEKLPPPPACAWAISDPPDKHTRLVLYTRIFYIHNYASRMSTSTSVPAAYIVGSRNTKPRSSVNTVEIFSIHDDGMEGFGDMDTFTDSVVSGESHPEARRIQLASGYLTAVQSIDYRYLGGLLYKSQNVLYTMLETVTLRLHAWKTAWKMITRETTTDGRTPRGNSMSMKCRCPFKCFVAPCHTVVKPTLTPLLCSLLPGFIMCSVCIVVCRCSWSCTFSSPSYTKKSSYI